ncbi:MAG: Hsp20/alpha crystallin family protein [Acidimicrobiaceae bacterium]|nr:Hsp20/alpha crystallin family protein [Acidimicrobiaceae bacterium]
MRVGIQAQSLDTKVARAGVSTAMFELEQPLRELGREGPAWHPEVDVFERADGFLLCFAVPGVREDEVEVIAADDVLTVRGLRQLTAAEEATPRRVELPRGRFERRVRLPGQIAAEEVRTQLTQGLLLVHVPRPRGYVRVKVERKP